MVFKLVSVHTKCHAARAIAYAGWPKGRAVPGLCYGVRESLRLFVPVLRARFFASVSAVFSLVLETSFLDCWTISASFAFTRLVISRLSPVLGMHPPYELRIQMSSSSRFGRWMLLPALQKLDLLSNGRSAVIDELGVRLEIHRKVS